MGYLDAGVLIKARLEAQGLAVNQIGVWADLNVFAASAQFAPAIGIIYAGEQVSAGQGRVAGPAQLIEQIWEVWLVIDAEGDQTGESALSKASDLMESINAALQWWKPQPGYGRLAKAKGSSPWYVPGFGYYPLAYSCQISKEGQG